MTSSRQNGKLVADPILRNEVADWLPGQLEVKGRRRGQAAASISSAEGDSVSCKLLTEPHVKRAHLSALLM